MSSGYASRFSNIGSVINKFHARAAVIQALQEAASPAVGKVLKTEVLRVLDEKIYNASIPKRTWVLTRVLRDSQDVIIQGTTVVLKSYASYSIPRRNLGTPKGRPIRTPGVQSVQWQEAAVKNTQTRVRNIRRRALLKALNQ